jgi:glutathione S-transferase
MKILTFAEMKQPEYLAINPNGKAPAIVDPNTGVALWEVSDIPRYIVLLPDLSNPVLRNHPISP